VAEIAGAATTESIRRGSEQQNPTMVAGHAERQPVTLFFINDAPRRFVGKGLGKAADKITPRGLL